MKNGYSMCYNAWALDEEIKNELGLLLIISSLCAEKGYCFATNKYLAEQFHTTEVSISRKIKKLEAKKYITIEYKKRGCEVKSRYIRLTKMLTDDYQKCKSTINKNVKDNNISINNINNNKKENNKRKSFGEYENVKLTDEQYQKLIFEFPKDYEERIKTLDEYIQMKGDKYKDHLAVIRNWARKDKPKQSSKYDYKECYDTNGNLVEEYHSRIELPY